MASGRAAGPTISGGGRRATLRGEEEFQPMPLSRGGNRTAGATNDKTEEIRDYLVRAAEVCFERHGVTKTTIEDVAATANVSRPTIYRYFKNREGLLLAVLLRALRHFNAEANELIVQPPSSAVAVVES